MKSIGHAMRAIPTLLRVGLAELVAYRSELVIWILTASAPLLMLLVWDGVAAAGPINGYDQAAFARYFSAGLVVRQLTSAWVVWELNEVIRSGELSSDLLKPLHPLAFRAAENLAALPFRVLVLIPLLAVLYLWRPGMGLGMDLPTLPLWLVSVALAWLMQFSAQVAFGALAFYLDQSLGVFNVWFSLWAILSGYLFPLDMLPANVATVVALLPFRSMLAVPTELAAGTLHGSEALNAVGLQLIWVVIFIFAARALWRGGVRRYEAFGA